MPVARWAGLEFAAVLRIEWAWASWVTEDPSDDELVSVIQILRRTVAGWEESSDDGGGGWFDPPLRRPKGNNREVRIGGLHLSGWQDVMGGALWGNVGSDVTTLDLITENGIESRQVESAIGAFVVAFDASASAVFRMSTSDGTIVKTTTFNTETLRLE